MSALNALLGPVTGQYTGPTDAGGRPVQAQFTGKRPPDFNMQQPQTGEYDGSGINPNGMYSSGAQTGMGQQYQQTMQAPQQQMPQQNGMNAGQALAGGPVQGSGPVYEGQINRLMMNQGMTREQAMANQAAAVRLGADLNGDGTVGPQEFQQFQQNPSMVAPATGVIGSEMALGGANDILKRGGNQAVSDLLAGTQQARGDINTASQAALGPLSGYAQSGQGANSLQGNLLGANGYAAQAQAMRDFQNSPGQDFLRQEQERAVLRNAAATGGTQGGAVLEELQRRAFGRAGTAFNDRISQLGQLGDQGLTASQGLSGIMGDTGVALAGLAERGAGNVANTGLGIAGQRAGIQGTIAGGRTRAGEIMSQNVGNTTANLSTLQNQQGAGLADLLGGQNLAQIFQQAGITDANTQQQLATLLANIAAGQGSQAASLSAIPGVGQDPGILAGVGQLAAGVGGLMTGMAAPAAAPR
jgi:hypothetical protein